MDEALYEAYLAKRAQERPERETLNCRYAAVVDWLETNFNTLTHWIRFVEHVEQIVQTFREEEQAIHPFEQSCFMYELLYPDHAVPWKGKRDES